MCLSPMKANWGLYSEMRLRLSTCHNCLKLVIPTCKFQGKNFLFTNKDSRIEYAPLMILMLVCSKCRGRVQNCWICAHAVAVMSNSHHVFHVKLSRYCQYGLLCPTIFQEKRKISRREVKWLSPTHPEASGKVSKWEMGSYLSLIPQCKMWGFLRSLGVITCWFYDCFDYAVMSCSVQGVNSCMVYVGLLVFLPTPQQSTFRKIGVGGGSCYQSPPLPGACQRILAFRADALSPLMITQLPGQRSLLH